MNLRLDPVRDRILNAAVAAIDGGGVESLRVVAVANEAGASQGMIRYYFGSREGLVEEALAARFVARFGDMLDMFVKGVDSCSTQIELRDVTERVLDVVYSADRSRTRLERNSEIGTASVHPPLARRIAESRDAVRKSLVDVMGRARARGLLRKDADPAAIATVHLSLIHGYSIWELGEETIDRSFITDAHRAVLLSLMFD